MGNPPWLTASSWLICTLRESSPEQQVKHPHRLAWAEKQMFDVERKLKKKIILLFHKQRRLNELSRSKHRQWRLRSGGWSFASLWWTRQDMEMPSTAKTGSNPLFLWVGCYFLPKQTLTACSGPRPASAPSSATSTTSLNATSTMRAALIADTLLTIGSTAASISSPPLATGEWRSGDCLLYRLLFLLIPLFSFCFRPPSLKPLDVQFMKAIHNKVNVVPVIAKADTLTLRERERLKRRVRATVAHCSPNKQQPSCVDGFWLPLPRTENPVVPERETVSEDRTCLCERNSSCGCF